VNTIPITLSFINKWWSGNYYSSHERPVTPSDDELAKLYLARKRFFFDHFGEFGVGEQEPVPDGRYVCSIMKWCVDFIPYLLGVRLRCIEAGFWQSDPLTRSEIVKLKPVKLVDLPFAEWLVKRKRELIGKYGRAEMGQLIEGSVNAAYRIRGEEFFCDLAADKSFAAQLLDVITETVIMAYQFLAQEFDLNEVFLANCTNVHIGPEIYADMCLKNDIRIMNQTWKLMSADRFGYLHNCDTSADKFIGLYSQIPHLRKIDASYTTDIRRMKGKNPGTTFTAFINPVVSQMMPLPELKSVLQATILSGADEILFANIDTLTDVHRIRDLLRTITEAAREIGYAAGLTLVPFSEDEIEWAFPMYQGEGYYQVADDWRHLIP
jgi:hypothetical protein